MVECPHWLDLKRGQIGGFPEKTPSGVIYEDEEKLIILIHSKSKSYLEGTF